MHRFLSAVSGRWCLPLNPWSYRVRKHLLSGSTQPWTRCLLFDLHGCEVPHHGVNLDTEPGVEQFGCALSRPVRGLAVPVFEFHLKEQGFERLHCFPFYLKVPGDANSLWKGLLKQSSRGVAVSQKSWYTCGVHEEEGRSGVCPLPGAVTGAARALTEDSPTEEPIAGAGWAFLFMAFDATVSQLWPSRRSNGLVDF